MRHNKCALCEKHGKTHRRSTRRFRKKGSSALKVLKPRSKRIRRWDVD